MIGEELNWASLCSFVVIVAISLLFRVVAIVVQG